MHRTSFPPLENSRVSVVVPTYNERENLSKLIPAFFKVFSRNDLRGELIIVDDNSPDGSAEVVRSLQSPYPDLKIIVRSGKLGLSSAVLAGFSQASGGIFGVMDADFSHPLDAIPALVAPILRGEADVSVGSRYVRGGCIQNWPLRRRLTSRGAVLLARPLTSVRDPVSGFFFFRREVIDGVVLNPVGFKILLEILVRGRYSRVKEVPITFIDREGGKSKLNLGEHLSYVRHCLRLYLK
ncbi:MAG: polyprenol monophosphomannose synthase [Candidatus Altiarchaeota archaeon]|nr:polyprenol monophosphomannose synthase [Candidatus Altiarchaeota archaeon]